MFWRSRNCAKLSLLIAANSFVLLLTSCAGRSISSETGIGATEAVQVDRLELLESRWGVASRSQRLALKSELEKFLSEYPNSEQTDRVRVLLAWVLVEEGKLQEAELALADLVTTQGRLIDEKDLLLGKIARRAGDPDKSLQYLLTLRGKLLTEEARQAHSAELVASAIAARRYRLAVDAMVVRVEQAQATDANARAVVLKDISSLPSHALLRIIGDFYAEEAKSKEDKDVIARAELLEVIVNYLARKATTQKEARLARDLLEAAPAWLRAGPYGDELSNLSQLVTEEAKIRGRTIGVVLGGADPGDHATQARSIQVALGLSRGLKSIEAPAVDLVFAENRGSLQAALGVLTGLGASILITGVDPQQSALAIAYANKNEVPVLVLTPPPPEVSLGEFGFSLGVSEAEQLGFLRTQFAQESPDISEMILQPIFSEKICVSPLKRDQAISQFLESLDGRRRYLFSFFGSVSCARGLLLTLQQRNVSSPLILGLEASPLQTTRRAVTRISVGTWQAKVKTPQFFYSQAEKESFVAASDWFGSLGRDAARLATMALITLPDEETVAPEQVQARYRETQEALTRVKSQLLTTDAQGFDARHRIPYEMFFLPSPNEGLIKASD